MRRSSLSNRGGAGLAAALALLCGLFVGPVLSAQAPSPTASEMASRVDRHYNQLTSLKAGFTENYEGMGVRRTESGTLLLKKPGRMKWDYSSPAGKIFLLDGKFAWFYTQGDVRVQRIPAKELDDLRSPLRFLLGHTELGKEMTGLSLARLPNGEYALTGQPKGQENRVSRLKDRLPESKLSSRTAQIPGSLSVESSRTPPSAPTASSSRLHPAFQ